MKSRAYYAISLLLVIVAVTSLAIFFTPLNSSFGYHCPPGEEHMKMGNTDFGVCISSEPVFKSGEVVNVTPWQNELDEAEKLMEESVLHLMNCELSEAASKAQRVLELGTIIREDYGQSEQGRYVQGAGEELLHAVDVLKEGREYTTQHPITKGGEGIRLGPCGMVELPESEDDRSLAEREFEAKKEKAKGQLPTEGMGGFKAKLFSKGVAKDLRPGKLITGQGESTERIYLENPYHDFRALAYFQGTGSAMIFEDYGTFKLERGEAWFKIDGDCPWKDNNTNEPLCLRVKTPYAIIDASGTDFLVAVTKDMTTLVWVHEGKVNVWQFEPYDPWNTELLRPQPDSVYANEFLFRSPTPIIFGDGSSMFINKIPSSGFKVPPWWFNDFLTSGGLLEDKLRSLGISELTVKNELQNYQEIRDSQELMDQGNYLEAMRNAEEGHFLYYQTVLELVQKESEEMAKQNQAAESKGGGCLIATATFGSELAPQVQQLRETRDNVLLSSQAGTTFMTAFNQFYYSFSPTVADWERQNPVFKEAVRIAITPLITTLSILNYADIDSEAEMLFYGIVVVLLNIGIYFLGPAFVIMRLRHHEI